MAGELRGDALRRGRMFGQVAQDRLALPLAGFFVALPHNRPGARLVKAVHEDEVARVGSRCEQSGAPARQ